MHFCERNISSLKINNYKHRILFIYLIDDIANNLL